VETLEAEGAIAVRKTLIAGFGVHISFIRSITMDKWKDLERLKMKVSFASELVYGQNQADDLAWRER
jgi:hypothetical protein